MSINNDNVRSEDISGTTWGLFSATGAIGYYMLYKALKSNEEDLRGEPLNLE